MQDPSPKIRLQLLHHQDTLVPSPPHLDLPPTQSQEGNRIHMERRKEPQLHHRRALPMDCRRPLEETRKTLMAFIKDHFTEQLSNKC